MDVSTQLTKKQKYQLIYALSSAAFLVFFQAYMVAPIIPKLALVFNATAQDVGLIIPIYMISFAITALTVGILSDKFGKKAILLISVTIFASLTILTATSSSLDALKLWRLVTGIGAAGIMPIALTTVGMMFPQEERGKPLGIIFASMSGGTAVGASSSAWAIPLFGWQGLFVFVGILAIIVVVILFVLRNNVPAIKNTGMTLSDTFKGYYKLITNKRGWKIYTLILCNGIFANAC